MLDDLFTQAAQAKPGDDLFARVMADGQKIQDMMKPVVSSRPAHSPAPAVPFWRWPVWSGLALAGVAGLVMGVQVPSFVETLNAGDTLMTFTETDMFAPDLSFWVLEDENV
jgi:hypothetical protein